MMSTGNATTQTNGANGSHTNKFGSTLSHRTIDLTPDLIKGLQQLFAHMQQQQQQEPQQAERPMRAVTSGGHLAQRAAHSRHSVGRSREALTACPQVHSFIDRHVDQRIVMDRKNSIEQFFSIERFRQILLFCHFRPCREQKKKRNARKHKQKKYTQRAEGGTAQTKTPEKELKAGKQKQHKTTHPKGTRDLSGGKRSQAKEEGAPAKKHKKKRSRATTQK